MTESSQDKSTRPARPRPPAAAPAAGSVPPAPPTASHPTPFASRPHLPPAVPGAPPAPSTARPARRTTYHPDARISLLAVMGTVWASLFFMMLILSWLRSRTPLLPEIRPPLWHALLDYIIQPLGWSAPIAATVLGLLAIGQIQKAQGEKYGLSLALFDALLFPLLLVDVLVVWLWQQLASALILQDVISPKLVSDYGSAVPVVIIILGNYYLATRAWAAVQSEAAS